MTLNTILRRCILLGLFIVPFIPFVVANSLFFPFITGKAFTFRIIVEIILGCWAVLALTDRKYMPKGSALLYGFAAFVALIALSDIFGANPFKSFWSNFERMEGLITLIHLFAYFVVASTVLSTEKLWNWFWTASIVASLGTTIFGFMQLAGKFKINQGGARLDATFGNASYLAIYVLFHIFITAFILVSPQLFLLLPFTAKKDAKYWKWGIGAVIIILEGIILYYTATRGAFLGLIGGGILTSILIIVFEKNNTLVKKISMAVLIGAVAVVGAFFLFKNSSFVTKSPVLSRYSSISLNDPTTKSRFLLWNMAYQGFKERPILGWGQENFNFVFNKYYSPKLYGQEQWFDRTHNIIFDWLIAGGILGLGSYLFFYAALIWYIWKRREGVTAFSVAEKSILTGMLLGYFIHNLFVFDNLVSYVMFMSVAAYVYSRTALWNKEYTSSGSENRFIGPVALAVTLVVIYFFNVIPIQSNKTLIAAITPYGDGKVDKNIAAFKEVIATGSIGTAEAREQLLGMAGQLLDQPQTALNAQSRSDLIALAGDEMKKQIAQVPNDARFQVLMGSFLTQQAKYAEALPYLSKAADLSPQKQTILFAKGIAYIGNQDYPRALETFKKAYDLEPKYTESLIQYAAAALYAKNDTLAQELLKKLDPQTVIHDDRILRAYYITGQTKPLLAIWKERLAQNPTDPQLHLSLAAAYLLANDRKNAIAEIQAVIKLEPGFKEQGDFYIKEIQAGRNP